MFYLIKDIACNAEFHKIRQDVGQIIGMFKYDVSIKEGFSDINLAFQTSENYNNSLVCGCKSRVEML